MTRGEEKVFIEIVAKKKGCMLCDLAIAILEEIAEELEPETLRWEVVDMGSREGILRHQELKKICGRAPLTPSLVINEQIAFDHIPDMEALSTAVHNAMAV